MPRFAATYHGIVIGILQAAELPTINVPRDYIYVNVTDLPEVKVKDEYDPDTGLFQPPQSVSAVTVETRLAKLEADVALLKKV